MPVGELHPQPATSVETVNGWPHADASARASEKGANWKKRAVIKPGNNHILLRKYAEKTDITLPH